MIKKTTKTFGERLRIDMWNQRYLYIMMLPGIVFYLIYRYWPMVGLAIAFREFSFTRGMFGGEFIGFRYFQFLFFQHRDFWNIVRNTFLINVYRIFFYFPVPVIFALMINEILSLKYKRLMQTIVYLPHFVSWVVFGSIIIIFLAPEGGIVNAVIKLFGGNAIFFMTEPKYFRVIVVITDILKQAGWGTIIYLAAITGIDPTLYESARIDGASKFQMILFITLPSISSTIVVLLLLNIGRIMEVGFEQIFVLYNPLVYETGDVISTYVYRVGLGNARFSLTTAIGLFQSIIGFTLLLSCNAISKKLFDRGLW